MVPVDSSAWDEEVSKLIAARERYIASLEAIQDIADFATESSSSLNMRDTIRLTISSEAGDANSAATRGAATALVGFFGSFLKVLRENPSISDEIARIGETAKHDAPSSSEEGPVHTDGRVEMPSEIKAIFDEFTKSMPSDFDGDISNLISVSQPRRRIDLLMASLLTAAVGDFEVFFTSLIRFFYKMRPEALRDQGSAIPWSEIEQYDSLEDLKNYYIEERVSKIMYQGFSEWMEWLSRQLRIKYEEVALAPDETNEMFQRRHIIVHNGGRVSRQYLSKVPHLQSPPALGSELKIERDYLDSSIDRLRVLGISLAHQVMSRLCRDQSYRKKIDEDIVDMTFELLTEKRWGSASRVAETASPQMSYDSARLALQVNRWIGIKNVSGIAAIRAEVSAWDVGALQQKFQMARAVLLEEASAIDMVQQMLNNGELSSKDLATWPLLADIRQQIEEKAKQRSENAEDDASAEKSTEPT
jgi:hypothetical protein